MVDKILFITRFKTWLAGSLYRVDIINDKSKSLRNKIYNTNFGLVNKPINC